MKCAMGCGRSVLISKLDICRRCRERARNTQRVALNRFTREKDDLNAAQIEARLRAGDAARRRQKWGAQ